MKLHFKFVVPFNVFLCVILVANRCSDDTDLMYAEFQSYASKTLDIQGSDLVLHACRLGY